MLLIITGCIKVNINAPYVVIRDEDLRLNDYIETIIWAIESKIFDKIIFCDNSGYIYDDKMLQNLSEKRGKQFEWLCFQADTEIVNKYGKGYGEGEIIKYALNNSKIISDHEKFFCKITGRLKISNIDNLIKENSNCFMKKHFLKEIDTRFYCVSIIDYEKYLLDIHKKVNDSEGKYLECVFYDAFRKRKIKYKMFKERPLFLGASGSTGRKYADVRKKYEVMTDLLCRSNIYNSEMLWNVVWYCKNMIGRNNK